VDVAGPSEEAARVRRFLLVLTSTMIVLVATSAPASAKTPPFTVQLSDPTPQPGARVSVTVRMWDPADRSNPSTLVDLWVPRPGELLGLVSADELVNGRPRPGNGTQEPIALRNVAPATFRGTFVAPEQGEYRIVPFPGLEDRLLLAENDVRAYLRHYPTTDLAVQSSTGDDAGWPVVPLIATGSVGAIAIMAPMRWRRSHRRRPA
jgi:hypothetical protein